MAAKKSVPIAAITCLILTVLFTVFSSTVSSEARRGLELCSSSVIPALFPVFVINGLLLRLGGAAVMKKLLGGIVSFIFGTPESCAYSVVIGLLSGAPAGVISLSASERDGAISWGDAEASLLACAPLSFPFVYGAIGVGMLGDGRKGLLLYIIQLTSIAAVSHLLTFGHKRKTAASCVNTFSKMPFSAAFTHSLRDALDGIIGVCGAVVFFSAMSGIVSVLPFLSSGARLFSAALLEVTSGASEICGSLEGNGAFICLCAAVGWSGVSVISQCANAVNGRFGIRSLLLGKALTSLLCALAGFIASILGVV